MNDWNSENGNGRWRDAPHWTGIDTVIAIAVIFYVGLIVRSCN